MLELFPHQQQVINDLREGLRQGHKRQILAMPTGSGKTVVAGQLARNAAERDKRVLFVVHLRELVNQAVDHFARIGLRVGVLQGENTDYRRDDDVIVASIQTIASRSAPDWVRLVIIDEAHILHREHIVLMEKWSALPFIGLSATPLRQDLGHYFSNLVRGPTVAWLTEYGFLVPAKAMCPGTEHMTAILNSVALTGGDYNQKQLGEAINSPKLVADITETYQRFGQDRQTLVFAVDKAHSRAIVEDFLSVGIKAAHIEDRTPPQQRQELIQAFRAREIRILSSVGVLAIGFDVPDASCAILARPTQSEALYLQQVGRVIRRANGKTDALLLDHAGNVLRHGLPVRFEVPDLSDRQRETPAKRRKREPKLIACSSCSFALEPGQQTCPNCGIDRPRPGSNIENLDGELVEYGASQEGRAPSKHDKRRFYRELLWIAQERSYANGWVYFKYQAKHHEKPPHSWRQLHPLAPSPSTLRWVKSQQIRYAKRHDEKKGSPYKTPDESLIGSES